MAKDKILYVGSSWNVQTTQSAVFLVDFLKEYFDIDTLLDSDFECMSADKFRSLNSTYFAIIFFQLFPSKKIFSLLEHENIIFFPMYDTCSHDYNWWVHYQNVKIVNFSKKTHQLLKKWGFNSLYVQYFPKPLGFQAGESDGVFFWQRREEINIRTLAKLFGYQRVKIHIHKVMDPGHSFTQPSKEDELRFGISYSNWFESRELMNVLIAQKGIYVAPRIEEGIGMSFLGAMAMGKAVVAVDKPTMNEYIEPVPK